MADYCLDTSALGKHYHTEIGTPEVDGLLAEPGARHFISITPSDFQLLRRRFLTDVSRRQFHVVRMTGLHYQEAERLIRSHGPGQRIRTLDALHLSVALELRGRGLLDHLVCADTASSQ